MINVDDLLKPVAEGNPCGEDFTYNQAYLDLQRLAEGTPEVDIGNVKKPAEEPNWKQVSDKAVEVLQQSKHLGAGILLTTSLLKMAGIEGLRDGLAVIRGITETYWADLYPKLDPEDNNDPTERLNIIGSLSSSRFSADVRKIVVCSTPLARITLQDVIAAKEGKPAEAGKPALGMGQIEAMFRDAGPEKAKATLDLIMEAIGHTQGLESFLDSTVGAGNGANFENLNKALAEMKQTVEPYAGNGASDASGTADASQAEGVPTGDGQPAARATEGLSGTIRGNDDVTRALDMICDYYKQNEPSSPVPLILERAKRLVNKDFTAILTDLTPDAVRQLCVITGQPEPS